MAKKKITQFETYEKFITENDLANLFNVFTDPSDGEPYKTYNMNKTLVIKGLSDVPVNAFNYYEVKPGDTWNLISYKTYGTIQLYWLILKVNNIHNATIEPETGWVIKTLPKDVVQTIITQMKRG